MLSASTPQREICAQLHIGRGVLNRYKKLADEAKVDYGTIGRMSEEQNPQSAAGLATNSQTF